LAETSLPISNTKKDVVGYIIILHCKVIRRNVYTACHTHTHTQELQAGSTGCF